MKYRQLYLLIVSFLISFSFISAQQIPNKFNKNTLYKPSIHSKNNFDGNRIDCDMENNGMFVTHNISGRSGLTWPKGNNTQTVFASGVWLGGRVYGEVRVSAGEYAGEYASGPWSANHGDPKHKIYKVNKHDLADPINNLDIQNWPVGLGAPWVDENENGVYDPLPFGPDHPHFIGDQVIWMVMNDGLDSLHQNVFHTAPLGVEVQRTIFGFDRPDALGDMMFIKDLIINKSSDPIDEMYVSIWSDPDLGNAGDDFVGCDTTLGMGICYNDGPDSDFSNYMDGTPAVGYDFFQGPIVPVPGETAYAFRREIQGYKNLQMTSFVGLLKRWNMGDNIFGEPNSAIEAYNLMKGLNNNGTAIDNKYTGGSQFTLPGDPTKNIDNLDNEIIDRDFWASHDRRFLMNSGPFRMAPGDSQEIVFAVFMAADGDPLDSYLKLKEVDAIAQYYYDNKFRTSFPPPTPQVAVTSLADQIILTWDNVAEAYKAEDIIDIDLVNGNITYYEFEGYNVYQFESTIQLGEMKRIATFDKINGITKIADDVFVPEYGKHINIFVQQGSDSGINHSFLITQDALDNNSNLKINREYYFAVTAYGYNPNGIPKTLESRKEIIAVRPQIPNTLYVDSLATIGSELEVTHVGPSQGSVYVSVIDPTKMVDADYSIVFAEDLTWSLLKGSDVLFSGQENQSGNADYQIVDGIMAWVIGPPLAINNWDYAGNRWVSGTNWGGSALFGSLDLGSNFLVDSGLLSGDDGSISATDYIPILMDWQDDVDILANGYAGKAYVYRRDLGYAFAGIGETPFTVWETDWETMTQKVRQLNVCFTEDVRYADPNFIWDMGAAGLGNAFPDEEGAREYMFIMNTTYDLANGVGTTYDDVNFGPSADVLYAFWPKNRGTRTYASEPFTIWVWPNRVNSTLDTFTFSSVAALTKEYDSDNIKAWPNPYFGYNPEEKSATDRQIHFTHLPETGKCIIRIFDLVGEFVRKIEHNNSTQFEIWDVRDFHSNPVASGMYIVHIETEQGEKILKLAVIQPQL